MFGLPDLFCHTRTHVVASIHEDERLSPLLVIVIRETCFQRLGSEGKYTFNIPPHQERVSDKIKWHGVTHQVAGDRASVSWLEGVLVNPLPVRPADLLVHKTMPTARNAGGS